MSTVVGSYDHLDKRSPIQITLSMEKLAELVENSNYGVHRFLSALIRLRKKKLEIRTKNYQEKEYGFEPYPDRLMNEIERLLNEGEF